MRIRIRIHNSEFMNPNSGCQLITDPLGRDLDPPHFSSALKTRFGCVGDTCALVSRGAEGFLNSGDFSIYREKDVLSCQLKIRGASEKFKNQPRPLLRPRSVNFRQHFRNLSRKTVPLALKKSSMCHIYLCSSLQRGWWLLEQRLGHWLPDRSWLALAKQILVYIPVL